MKQLKLVVFLFVVVPLFFGCRSLQSFSPEQIIENAIMAEVQGDVSYYAEIDMKITSKNESLNEVATIKEWRRNGLVRNELISDKEGEVIITANENDIHMYFVDKKKIVKTTMEDVGQYVLSPKEQFHELLNLLRKTHDIETVGKATIADRPAFHLKATTREGQNSIYGNIDLWIDVEYWLPLKMIMKSGSLELVIEFTEIDYDATFDDALFVLGEVEDAEIEVINSAPETLELTLEEVPEHFGKPVYVLEENDRWKISSIHLTKADSIQEHDLLQIDYTFNGVPSLSLLISQFQESDPTVDVFDDVTKKVTVRNQEGYLIDSAEIVMLSWRENGLEYAVQLINPKIDINELFKLAESMMTIK